MPFLSQDDLREQALKLEQRLADAEAEKSQVCTELQDLQRQLSQNQEGKKLKASGEIWREGREEARSPEVVATLCCSLPTVRSYLETKGVMTPVNRFSALLGF